MGRNVGTIAVRCRRHPSLYGDGVVIMPMHSNLSGLRQFMKSRWILPLLFFIFLLLPRVILAQGDAEAPKGFLASIDAVFANIVELMSLVLFISIGGIPLIVLWLIGGAIFFTIRMKFVNFRAFKHAVDVVQGHYDNPEEEGELTHFQALAAALSATVGLGNIAGVAIAIQTGGPGAAFWMTLGDYSG